MRPVRCRRDQAAEFAARREGETHLDGIAMWAESGRFDIDNERPHYVSHVIAPVSVVSLLFDSFLALRHKCLRRSAFERHRDRTEFSHESIRPQCPVGGAQSTFNPDPFTTLAHFAISRRMYAPNSS